ncbi:hypothetical protein GCM10027271_09170 [Saccharopolyspora gloriosae]|uniref:Uncharacterized protein n=1 Tax=Saccharopolyspora gloriosae TaxID=455344 RepID=A0A840NR11_9PSEU|nr:hypothetical protein [Saccharopolyspora gloriosae]MBB5072463.1 hypothetical protein [Saccharopolyspora gloriosae]
MTEDGRPLADQDGPQRSDQPSTGGSADDVTQANAGGEQQDAGQARGRMRYQDESTTPREPTLAEKRARIAAEKRQEEQAQAALAEQESKTQKRRRVMVGGGVTVGVVALVAAFYSGSAYSAEQNAVQEYCAAEKQGEVAQNPDLCDENYVREQGGYSSGGMFFMPIFLPGGGIGGYNSYRYGYTPPGAPAPTPGQTVSGGSFNKPADANIKNTKGQTVQRGGFGISNKSGSSGS